jgi:hypothetical protein
VAPVSQKLRKIVTSIEIESAVAGMSSRKSDHSVNDYRLICTSSLSMSSAVVMIFVAAE